MGSDTPNAKLGKVIQIDEAQLRGQLGDLVRESVEETLNALLDAEADDLCRAKRYERSSERVSTRAGHYQRSFHTKAGEVTLKMPKLRSVPFETAIVERYRRHHRGVVGHSRQLGYGQQAQPEDLQEDRRLAESAVEGHLPVPLPRRHLPEAQLGR